MVFVSAAAVVIFPIVMLFSLLDVIRFRFLFCVPRSLLLLFLVPVRVAALQHALFLIEEAPPGCQ